MCYQQKGKGRFELSDSEEPTRILLDTEHRVQQGKEALKNGSSPSTGPGWLLSGANVVTLGLLEKEQGGQGEKPVGRKRPAPRICPLTGGTEGLQTEAADFHFLQPQTG